MPSPEESEAILRDMIAGLITRNQAIDKLTALDAPAMGERAARLFAKECVFIA